MPETQVDEKTLVECDHCHELKWCEYVDDPFMEEVYGWEDGYQPELSWWCEDCWSTRHDDV